MEYDIEPPSSAHCNLNLEEVADVLGHELQTTNQRIAQLTKNLDSLDDNAFMEELTRLREEHKRTLEACRTLYKWYVPPYDSGIPQYNEDISSNRVVNEFPLEDAPNSVDALTYGQYNTMGIDERSGFLSYPSPYFGGGDEDRSEWNNEMNRVRTQNTEKLILSSEQAIRNKVREAWRRVEAREFQETNPSNSAVRRSLKERPKSADRMNSQSRRASNSQAVARAQSSLSSAPMPRSISQNNVHDKREENYLEDASEFGWKHRITVPKPFRMTLREEKAIADASKRPKTRSMLQLERDLLEKSLKEEEELRQKNLFRAKPIPANVYLPLFETLQEQQRARREFVHKYNVQLLKAQEKPFRFYIRESEKKRMQNERKSAQKSEDKPAASKKEPHKNKNSGEKHKPVPRSVYENRSEHMKEEQLLREIMAKKRAKQLLSSASAPHGMTERERQKMEKIKTKEEKLKREQAEAESRAKESKWSKSVPDFARLHQKSEVKRMQNWKQPQSIPTKPFSFHTATRSADRSVKEAMKQPPPIQTNQNASSPSRRPPHYALFSAMEIAEPSTNNSTVLRDNKIKNRLEKSAIVEEEKEKARLRRQRKEKEIHETLRQKCDIVDPRTSVEQETLQRLRRLRESEFDRSKEYQERLQEMDKKVKERPLLIEQYQASAVKKRAEKRYQDTLKAAGIHEDDLYASYPRDTGNTLVAYPQKYTSNRSNSSASRPDAESKRMEFGCPDENGDNLMTSPRNIESHNYDDNSFEDESIE